MSRVIVIHSRYPVINQIDAAAHCFGPFDSYEEALAWDQTAPDDCYKWALDLVGADDQDVEAQPTHNENHEGWHGSGPSNVERLN